MLFIKYGVRFIFRLGLVLIGLINFSCEKKPPTKYYFPEIGRNALLQRALELRNNLNVLSIALEPGYEDLAALAYFRLQKGANIMSAYLTNGEAGESDRRGEYPNDLAATRRLEAGEAISYLDGEVYFINLPHIIAARDSDIIRKKWPKKKVEKKFIELINQFKPDIILLARDWAENGKSLRWIIFKEDLLSAVRKMTLNNSETPGRHNWSVTRVMVDDPDKIGNQLPIEKRHPRFGKKFSTIGREAAEKYQSLSVQRIAWMKGKRPNYSIIYPSSAINLDELDWRGMAGISNRLRWIAQEIEKLSEEVLRADKESSLKHLVTILDSVNIKIGRRFKLSPKDQRALFHWKNGLERLRCTLLGIQVKYTVSEEILTMRQLTYVTVEKIEGLEEEGNTTVFFGGLEEGWVVNEGFEKKFPYKPGNSYRLLSPSKLDLTTPQSMYGLELAKLTKPVMLFIIHRAPTKEKSFIYRSIINFRFAPKFTTEILTPIVRMIPGEKLIVRLTNHSRDGVTDTVKVVHEIAESTPGPFRLSQKEATQVDTLTLFWKGNPKEGSYLLPLEIRGFNVGKFVARKFDARVDFHKKVGLIAGVKDSPMQAALIRLGLIYMDVDPENNFSAQIQRLNVLIIDRRALTLKKKIKARKRDFERFIRNGGHIIYLAQDPEEWNNSKIWEEIKLMPTQKFDESIPLETDKKHPFLSYPNQIEPEDWESWLYLRAYNIVTTDNPDDFSIPVKAKDGDVPLVLTKTIEKGRLTYIDLALHPQLLNVHSGAFRLIANIISI